MTDSSDLSRGSGVMTSSVICPAEGEQTEREGGRPQLGDLRSHLTCVLCAGYFIDATTIVECLHTFCRSCILRHLKSSSYCPVCAATIHRTKASSSLRADRILQTLVYKMVPDLFRQEMRQRRDFYERKPDADPELPGWAKGDVTSYVPHVFTADEHLHLRLALFDADRCDEGSRQQRGTTGGSEDVPPVRYLRCQAGTPLSVLQKFIRSKFQLPPSVQVQLIHDDEVLPADISLMDVGYMHQLTQGAAISLSFRLVRRQKRPVEPAAPAQEEAAAPAQQEQEPPAKRLKTDEQVTDICNDKEESIVSAPKQETPAVSQLREDEVPEEPDVNRDEEESSASTDGEVSDVEVGKDLVLPEGPDVNRDEEESSASTDGEVSDVEVGKDLVLPEGPDVNRDEEESNALTDSEDSDVEVGKDLVPEEVASEQDSGISEPTGDEKSTYSECESRDEEMADVSRPDMEDELAAPGRPTTDTLVATVKQQGAGISQQETNAILQEIDLNRQQKSVDREQTKNTDQQTVISREQTEGGLKEINVGEKEKDVSRPESDDEPTDIAVPQTEEVGAQKPPIYLERMFDPDDEEPTSPQIVEDIIASLDAEDSEDITPTAATPAPEAIRVGSPVPIGLRPEPVTVNIPRPGGHRLVHPISPLARVPATSQLLEPANVAEHCDPKRVLVDPSRSMMSADVPVEASAPRVGAAVTDSGADVIRQVSSDRGVGGAAGNEHNVENSAASRGEDKAKAAPTGDDVRNNKLTKSVSKDRLLHATARETDTSLSSSIVNKSSYEPHSLNAKASLDNAESFTFSTPVVLSRVIMTPSRAPSSDKKETSAKTDPKVLSGVRTAGSTTPKPITPQRITESEVARPSVANTSVATSVIRELGSKRVSVSTNGVPESGKKSAGVTTNGAHESNRKESNVSADDGAHKATGSEKEDAAVCEDAHGATMARVSNTKSTAAESVVLIENANIETADSPKPANTANGVSRSLTQRDESVGHAPHSKSREKPKNVGRSSMPVSSQKTLTATGAAVRGISAIATEVREGEVIIERVPNVFVQTSTVGAEKGDRLSASKVDAPTARSKVDCSVQTMPVAKTPRKTKPVVYAEAPKSVASVPPKMVDTGTATAEFVPANRPASVPHRMSSEGRDQASSGRRVSSGDSHARRPPVSHVHTKMPSVGDIHPIQSFSGEQQQQRPSIGELHQRKPSSDDTSLRRFPVEASVPKKSPFGENHLKLSCSVPRPTEIPASAEALRRVTSEEIQPFGRLTSGISKPYSSSQLKVPHITNKYLLSARTPTSSKSQSKTKHHKSNKSEKEKRLHVPYSLWKNLTAAKAASDATKTMSQSAASPRIPDPSPHVNVPLDLTTHVRKTVAADSTSMLAKTPSPPPKPKPSKPKAAKAQSTQTIHSIVSSLANRQHISLTPITSVAGSSHKPSPRSRAPTPRPPSPYLSSHLPMPMPIPMPEYSFAPGGLFTPPLHVNTSMASHLGYDMAMRNLLTLSHMAMAQGGMVRPHMFPMQPMFPPRPKSHDFHPFLDPSLLRQQSEARMGAASKKASPTAGTTAPQLRTPTALTSASIQHMEDLTRTVGKRADKERHSVPVRHIPSGE